MRSLVSGLAAVLFLSACEAPQTADAPKSDQIEQYANDDARMNAAVAEARRTFPGFVQKLSAGELTDAYPKIKVGLAAADGSREHIWVAEPRVEGDRISGVLANEPAQLPGQHEGSPVTFTAEQVSDWSYERGGRMWGNYTTRVMLPRLDPAQAADLRTVLSETPVEPTAR
jgi:uncharacterized protein YegJ (DUF2314 family)